MRFREICDLGLVILSLLWLPAEIMLGGLSKTQKFGLATGVLTVFIGVSCLWSWLGLIILGVSVLVLPILLLAAIIILASSGMEMEAEEY